MNAWIAKFLMLVLIVIFSAEAFAYQSQYSAKSAGCMNCHQVEHVKAKHQRPVKKIKK